MTAGLVGVEMGCLDLGFRFVMGMIAEAEKSGNGDRRHRIDGR